MRDSISIVLLLFGVFCYAADECPENSIFAKVSCSKTCKNVYNDDICPTSEPGCQCKENYYLNKEGKCVSLADCGDEVVCPSNTTFTICGSSCPTTCLNRFQSSVCTDNCKVGCFPERPYVLNKNGRSILETDCTEEPECDTGMIYKSCGHLDKCRSESSESVCQPGCYCEENHRFSDDKHGCVPISDCETDKPTLAPIRENCPRNTTFLTCGSSCPKTCQNRYQTLMCTDNCKIGCFPQPAYAFDKNGRSILETDCTEEPQCDIGMVFKSCGIRTTCNNYNESDEGGDCKPGCYCKEGYTFNEGLQGCVLHSYCEHEKMIKIQNEKCRSLNANMEYRECQSPSCVTTCERRVHQMCTAICVSGCYCAPGFAWRRTQNDCIPLKDCDIKTVN